MKKFKFKKIIVALMMVCCLMTTSLIATTPTEVKAMQGGHGESNGGGDTGNKSGNGNNKGQWPIPSKVKLQWKAFNTKSGARTFTYSHLASATSKPGLKKQLKELKYKVPKNCRGKYLYFTKGGSKLREGAFCWLWGNNADTKPPRSNPGGLADYDLLKAAWHDFGYKFQTGKTQNGYSKNFYYNPSTGKFLDIIWVPIKPSAPPASEEQGNVLVRVRVNGRVTYDLTNKSAEELWNYIGNSTTYRNKSAYGEYAHECKIVANYNKVTRTAVYRAVRTNGVITGYAFDHWNYSKSPAESKTKTITYSLDPPSPEQTVYNPYNLNRNGAALPEDLENISMPEPTGGDLNMSVNNYQNITDNKLIKALDTNTPIKFSVKYNNDYFGLPFVIEDVNPGSYHAINNGFDTNTVSSMGSGGGSFESEFNNGGQTIKLYESKTGDKYWGGSLHMGISSDDNASIQYNSDEYTGSNSFTRGVGFKGGNFNFRTIKVGEYYLSGLDSEYWCAQYTQGLWYNYGVEYRGTINCNGISNANICGRNLYCDLSSEIFEQPTVIGTFGAKTVGGTTN